MFTEFCRNIESDYEEKIKELSPEARTDIHNVHRAFATNTIFSVVCFLEANINEIFCDASEQGHNDRLLSLGAEKIDFLKAEWIKTPDIVL